MMQLSKKHWFLFASKRKVLHLPHNSKRKARMKSFTYAYYFFFTFTLAGK